MPATIVEDRVLARTAFEAIGWNASAEPDAVAGIALGQAVVALRVKGIAVTPEITRTVKADIALILADPAQIARARAFASTTDLDRPANEDRSAASLARVG